MIVEMRADAGHVADDGDAVLAEMRCGPEAREHQELR